MSDSLNPVDIIIGIIAKGIVLGIILAIAWPVKCLTEKSAGVTWSFLKGFVKPKKAVKYSGEI